MSQAATAAATALEPAPAKPDVDRIATRRRYLMCPPEHFEVRYAINPWMDPTRLVDRDLAQRQWDVLRQTYIDLGHSVELLDPQPGLPDMVFAANSALVLHNRAMGARFAHPQRRAEEPAYLRWLEGAGLASVTPAAHVSEGEGDFLVVGEMVLAGMGFRTDPASHAQAQELFGVPVVSLQLVDARYYHLDAAMTVLDDANVAYYPGAFSPGSRRVLERLVPDAVLGDGADAAVLGLNAVSDGRNVILAAAATGLASALRARGYHPIGVDLSELLKAGGGVKCCTLELRG
jgi:N-dimethylarginine dimethylaminohydrolase